MEPNTGAPVYASGKVQANLFIMPVQKFKLMKTFPEALLPLFWIENIAIPSKDLLKEVRNGVFLMKVAK